MNTNKKGLSLVLGCAVFISGILQAILIINLLLLLTSLTGSNTGVASYYLTSYYAAAFLLSLVVSYFADKTQKTTAIIFFLGLWSLLACVAFLSIANNYARIFAVIVGMPPLICITSLLFSLTGEHLNKQQTIIIRGVFSFAFVIGPPIGTTLSQFLGYDSIFLAIAGGVITTLVIIRLVTFDSEPVPAEKAHLQGKSDRYINTDVLIAFLALVFLHGSMSVTSSFLPLLVKDQLGVESTVTGIALGLCAFVEIVVIGVLARFSGINPNKIMIAGCVAGLLYFSVLVNATNAAGVIASQILNGAFIAVMVAIGLVWMQDIKGGGASIKTALFVNAYNVGAIILTPTVGYIAAQTGDLRLGISSALLGIVLGTLLLLMVFYRQNMSLSEVRQKEA